MSEDDVFIKIITDEEESEEPERRSAALDETWKIAIIDDEVTVHEATRLALSDVSFQGRSLEFVSAYSGEEGFHLLKNNPDCAVVFLDVVMEQDDAGLQLVQRIRRELGQNNLQIILRTGQPGYAPEEQVIIDYEINDYKTKSELSRDKLFTSLAAAIRSYMHLQALETSKEGLRSVIESSATLMKERSVSEFANGVLHQINALFHLSSQGIFCLSQESSQNNYKFQQSSNDGYHVVAATNRYKYAFGKDIQALKNSHAVQVAQRALETKQHVLEDSISALYLSTPSSWEGVVVIEDALALTRVDEELLRMFCMNMALGLENAKFFSYLNHAAFYDVLTGVFNRHGFVEHSKQVFCQAESALTLFIVDVDFFHEIFDSLGFEFSNKVLQSMGNILSNRFSDSGIVARLHADVFAVLLQDADENTKVLIDECCRALVVDGNTLMLGVTVGRAGHDKADGEFDIERLIRHGLLAVKAAKRNQRGTSQDFEKRFEEDTRRRLDILTDLRNALLNDELFLVLQPKVSMSRDEIVGYEALVRWNKNGTLIGPDQFIPVAEQAGLYLELDQYVFRKALDIIEAYPSITAPISINISANSIHRYDLVEQLKAIMQEKRVDTQQVLLEITENALVRSDTAIENLQALKALGFDLCLDDFGAGYSSLSYLLRLPLDVIKIDRAFVNSIVDDAKARSVLQGMIKICNDLGKRVVVEGVETQEQVDLLVASDVDVAQGYFYYRPLNIDDVVQLRGAGGK